MDLLSIILIAIGLAMDCLAVSITQGLSTRVSADRPRPFAMALLFGLFQGGMPLIGYYAGCVFADLFRIYAPWIALTLLLGIGGKMIWESLQQREEEKGGWGWLNLLLLAVATSIDALATGVIFIPVPAWLWLGISLIGLASFLFAIVGYLIGKRLGERFQVNVELIGGLILIGIGLKIWIEGFLMLNV